MEIDTYTRERITTCVVLSSITIIVAGTLIFAFYSEKEETSAVPSEPGIYDVVSSSITSEHLEPYNPFFEFLNQHNEKSLILIEPCILRHFLSERQNTLLVTAGLFDREQNCTPNRTDFFILTFYSSRTDLNEWMSLINKLRRKFGKNFIHELQSARGLVNHILMLIDLPQDRLIVHITCDSTPKSPFTSLTKLNIEQFPPGYQRLGGQTIRIGHTDQIFEKITSYNGEINSHRLYIPQKTFRFLYEYKYADRPKNSPCDTNQFTFDTPSSISHTRSKLDFIKDFIYAQAIPYRIDDFSLISWYFHCVDFPFLTSISTAKRTGFDSRISFVRDLEKHAQNHNWTFSIEKYDQPLSFFLNNGSLKLIAWHIWKESWNKENVTVIKYLPNYGRYEFRSLLNYSEQICSSLMYGSIKVHVPCDFERALQYKQEMERLPDRGSENPLVDDDKDGEYDDEYRY